MSSCKYNGLITKPCFCPCELWDPGQVSWEVACWRKEHGIGKQEPHLRPGQKSCNYMCKEKRLWRGNGR